MRALALALLIVTSAHADERSAVAGQLADVGTTAAGLALGAAEANPLGLLTLGVKAVAYQQIQAAPAAEHPALWAAFGAFGWGAAANNACVLASLATGGAAGALCPLVGLVAGLSAYQVDERAQFAAICEQAKADHPEITCAWNSAQTPNH